MSQKTHPAALTLTLTLLLLLASCAEGDTGPSGDRLYLQNGCGSCHGATGAGGSLGPALKDMSRFWDRNSMSAFFEDPKATLRSDERLSKLSKTFSAGMPAFQYLTDDQAGRIADFVLSLK